MTLNLLPFMFINNLHLVPSLVMLYKSDIYTNSLKKVIYLLSNE